MADPDLCPACETARRRQNKAMCGRCWRLVPKPVQEQLWAAWRAWGRDRGNVELFHNYRGALAAAVAEASARL